MPEVRRDRTGQVIGQRFRIDATLGSGAMADVFRALDTLTAAYVAVKILKDSVGDASAKARFEREGAVQARLRHHNVAALLASGVTDKNEPYLAVELLRGKTLRGVLKSEKALHPRRAASYAWQALQGLMAVHEAGVLHRDLKPANIMLEPSAGPIDRVVLIDFGFASFEGSARLTAKNTIVGSLQYVAPERLRGEPVDARSDLYAIGVILHEMIAGAPPFVGATQLELIEAHLYQPPPPLPDGLPASLQAVVAQALAKEPSQRFPTAYAMSQALERCAGELA